MKKIEALYEIRLHCSSLEEYNKKRRHLLVANFAIFCEEKTLFIQADHLTLSEYNRIKKIARLK